MHEVYALTPYQIQEIYFHRRDKDGDIAVPESAAPSDPASRIEKLLNVSLELGIAGDKIAELRRRLEAARNGIPAGLS